MKDDSLSSLSVCSTLAAATSGFGKLLSAIIKRPIINAFIEYEVYAVSEKVLVAAKTL